MLTRLLEEASFTSRVKCLIFDEAHFIVTSGQPDKEGNIFRSEYSKGYEIRIRLPLDIPCAIFSATMSQEVIKQILTSLRISVNNSNISFIRLTTNRKNLTYAVKQLDGPLSNLTNLDFIFPSLIHPPLLPPKKTLIFVPSTELALLVEPYLQQRLPSRMVSRLHASRSSRCKKRVIDDYCDPCGESRVLIATSVILNVSLRT